MVPHLLGDRGQMTFLRLYFDGTNYHQVMSTAQGILGLIIPTSREDSPHVVKLSDFHHTPTIYGLGLHKGYPPSQVGSFRIGYAWDSTPEQVYSNGEQCCNRSSRRYDMFTVDKELGRIAYKHTVGEIIVLALSPSRKLVMIQGAHDSVVGVLCMSHRRTQIFSIHVGNKERSP